MDLNIVTIQDCEEMMQYKNMAAVINDGNLIGFKGDSKADAE